jgi:hypothetical protein
MASWMVLSNGRRHHRLIVLCTPFGSVRLIVTSRSVRGSWHTSLSSQSSVSIFGLSVARHCHIGLWGYQVMDFWSRHLGDSLVLQFCLGTALSYDGDHGTSPQENEFMTMANKIGCSNLATAALFTAAVIGARLRIRHLKGFRDIPLKWLMVVAALLVGCAPSTPDSAPTHLRPGD